MTSKRSKSWIQVVSDWVPRWPRQKGVENNTGLDEEVQFNRVPERYPKGTLNKSAPSNQIYFPVPSSKPVDSDTSGDELYHDTSENSDGGTRVKHSTPYIKGSRGDPGVQTGSRLRPQAKVWQPCEANRTRAQPTDTNEGVRRRSGYTAAEHVARPVCDQGLVRGGDIGPRSSKTRVIEGPGGTSGRHVGRKQREPDKFDGERTEWGDYIQHFETVADWNGWSYEEKGMQLAMSLQGQAQRVLGDVAYYGRGEDYETLVGELSRRFNPVERETTYRLEFRNRVRRLNETVMEYGYSLRRLAIKAFPNIPYHCQEEWVLDQFITGLNRPELKRHVQFGHPRNLNEAISLAMEFESFEGSDGSKRVLSKPMALGRDLGGVNHLDGKESDGDNLMQKIWNSLQNSSKELGFLTNEVRQIKNQANGRPKNGETRPNFNKSEKVQCFRCKEMGHFQKDCPRQVQSNTNIKQKLN